MADKRYTINAFTVNLDLPSASAITMQSVDRLLELLASCDVRATVFADPALIRSSLLRTISESGHEIGLLWDNRRLLRFGEDVASARLQLQESAAGRQQVFGVRMRQFVLPSPWKLFAEELVARGFAYSSGTFPPRTFTPNVIDTQFKAHRIHTPSGFLWELPLTCWRPLGVGALQLMTSGGPALAGMLPVWTISRGVQGMNYHGEPAMLYALASTLGNRRVSARLSAVFDMYRFGSVIEAFASRLTTNGTPLVLRRTGIVRGITAASSAGI